MAKKTIIIIDCETNGLDSEEFSVLSASAIKFTFDIETKKSEVISEFDRYYYPKENWYNRSAIQVNSLDKENIDLKRRDVEYAEFFIDDKDWDNYIKGADIFVGHNIEYFDSKFMLDGRTEKKIEEFDMICTMILNIFEVKAEFEYPTPSDYSPYKYPSLYETAKFYGVDFDFRKLHGSLYDCQVVFEIFKKMVDKGLLNKELGIEQKIAENL